MAEDPLARPKPVRIADSRHPEIWNLVMPMRTGREESAKGDWAVGHYGLGGPADVKVK